MLEKIEVVDRVEILELGQIQVRKATKIIEDGVEISKTYHRQVLTPGEDLTGQDARVVAIANATWTEEVIENYQTLMGGSI